MVFLLDFLLIQCDVKEINLLWLSYFLPSDDQVLPVFLLLSVKGCEKGEGESP